MEEKGRNSQRPGRSELNSQTRAGLDMANTTARAEKTVIRGIAEVRFMKIGVSLPMDVLCDTPVTDAQRALLAPVQAP